MSLLEKARSKQSSKYMRNSISDDEIELVIAWLRDEITNTQVTFAYHGINNKRSNNILYRVALVLKGAYNQGKISINE